VAFDDFFSLETLTVEEIEKLAATPPNCIKHRYLGGVPGFLLVHTLAGYTGYGLIYRAGYTAIHSSEDPPAKHPIDFRKWCFSAGFVVGETGFLARTNLIER